MSFKADLQEDSNFTNKLKWFVVFVLLIAGLIANYHYSGEPWPLRLLGWIILLAIMATLALQTKQGKSAFNFARESKMELRKVFWPTRQETMQTTLFVAAMVVVLALILWAIDGGLMWAIGWLTGQRG